MNGEVKKKKKRENVADGSKAWTLKSIWEKKMKKEQ